MVRTPDQTQADATSTAARDAFAALAIHSSRHFGISLDAIWRAAGSPVGESPDAWLRLARAFTDATTFYRRRIHEATGADVKAFVQRPATWTVKPHHLPAIVAVLGDAGPFEAGDTLADEEIAVLYAMFLDRAGLLLAQTGRGRAVRACFRDQLAAATAGMPESARPVVVDPAQPPAPIALVAG